MISASGEKYPAMIIFSELKGVIPVSVRENLRLPENVYVTGSKSCYLGTSHLNDYFRSFLNRHTSKLVLADQYKVHMCKEAEQLYRDTNSSVIYIPGQCTKFLQPLDSIVMSAFKKRAEKHRIDTQIDMIRKRNKAGNIKPMNRQQLVNIVSKSWSEVPTEIIVKSFELTGIYGISHPSFMKHQIGMKENLNGYNC